MRSLARLLSLLCVLCWSQPLLSQQPFGSPTLKDPVYDLSNLVKAGFEMVEGQPAIVIVGAEETPPKGTPPPRSAPRGLAEISEPGDLANASVNPFDAQPTTAPETKTIMLTEAQLYRLDGSVVSAAEARKILAKPGPAFLTNHRNILPADKLLQQAMKDSVLVISAETTLSKPMARMVPQAKGPEQDKKNLPKGLVPLEDFR